ncbi:MAG: hypothetical protein IKM20_02970 [Erysipelotrichales bacterium]|nr:hypothetical protein [Erysipelotrichales bacterium]
MHKSFEQYELIGFFAVVVLGIAFHSLYELTSESIIVGLICPINESIWEHLKLLFYPYLIYLIFEIYTTKNTYSQLIIYKFYSVCLGMLTILILHYTYSGIIGKTYIIADISTFIISVAVSFFTSYYLIIHDTENKQTTKLGILLFIIMSLVFTFFTFYQPDLPLFEAPNKLSIISLLTLI